MEGGMQTASQLANSQLLVKVLTDKKRYCKQVLVLQLLPYVRHALQGSAQAG